MEETRPASADRLSPLHPAPDPPHCELWRKASSTWSIIHPKCHSADDNSLDMNYKWGASSVCVLCLDPPPSLNRSHSPHYPCGSLRWYPLKQVVVERWLVVRETEVMLWCPLNTKHTKRELYLDLFFTHLVLLTLFLSLLFISSVNPCPLNFYRTGQKQGIWTFVCLGGRKI